MKEITKSHRVNIRVTPSDYELFINMANEFNISKSLLLTTGARLLSDSLISGKIEIEQLKKDYYENKI